MLRFGFGLWSKTKRTAKAKVKTKVWSYTKLNLSSPVLNQSIAMHLGNIQFSLIS